MILQIMYITSKGERELCKNFIMFDYKDLFQQYSTPVCDTFIENECYY